VLIALGVYKDWFHFVSVLTFNLKLAYRNKISLT